MEAAGVEPGGVYRMLLLHKHLWFVCHDVCRTLLRLAPVRLGINPRRWLPSRTSGSAGIRRRCAALDLIPMSSGEPGAIHLKDGDLAEAILERLLERGTQVILPAGPSRTRHLSPEGPLTKQETCPPGLGRYGENRAHIFLRTHRWLSLPIGRAFGPTGYLLN